MTEKKSKPDIASGRIAKETIAENFSDLHPRLSSHEALVESDRCYFCYDAPCVNSCPTSIDIPQFIRQISTGNVTGSAKTIFKQNILGGMCARVCPTENLCEQACVRNESEENPVKIGQLQRFATDHYMDAFDKTPFDRSAPTGKKIAVIGAGPAGLACAHALSVNGHDVTIFEARDKAGGLNEYGIAHYKTVDNFAEREVSFILSIGGINVEYNQRLGENLALEELRNRFDSVFISIGLGGTNSLGIEGENLEGVMDAIEYISDLRQSDDLSGIPVGRNIVVIGGGMTAIDIAVQTKLLGAGDVTICYRRTQESMKSSGYEQSLARNKGVHIKFQLQPIRIVGESGHVTGIEFERTMTDSGGELKRTGEVMRFPADMVFKAVGQSLLADDLKNEAQLEVRNGKIVVDGNRKTNIESVWAGGDCISSGEDLTVVAVEDGKIAARSIHEALTV